MRISDVKINARRREALRGIDELADSIEQIGLLNPITVTEAGVLVAGRRRLEACKRLGWGDIPAIVSDLDDLGNELAEIDENLIRDELTVLERAEHLKRRKEIYEAIHPEADRPKGGRPLKNSEMISTFSQDTASKTGVTDRTIRQDVQIADKLDPNVKDAIRDTDLADHKTDLLRLAKMEPEEQKAVSEKIVSGDAKDVLEARRRVKKDTAEQLRKQKIQEIADTQGNSPDINVRTISIEDLVLPDESVDLFFTDPPYHDAHVDLYRLLSKKAAGALKPGCFLCCYAGKLRLPEVINAVSEHLEWVWIVSVFHPFSKEKHLGMQYNIAENWRPVLVFRKPGEMRKAKFQQDVVRAKRDKDTHDWQQDLDTPLQMIEAYTEPGELVVDPFCGGGTTLVAAKRLGRRWAGFDKDDDSVKLSIHRILNDGEKKQ